jgi:hypothetical protein
VGSIAFTITLPASLVTRTLVFFQMPSFFISSGFISQIEQAVKYSGVVFPFSIACPSSTARWVIIFRIIFVMPDPRKILGCKISRSVKPLQSSDRSLLWEFPAS